MSDGDARTAAGAERSQRPRHTVTYERSPVDVLRLAIGALVLVVVLLVMWLAGPQVVRFVGDVFSGIDAVPQWIIDLAVLGSSVLALVLLVAGVVVTVARRLWRLLALGLGAAISAAAVGGLLLGLVDEEVAPPAAVPSSVAGLYLEGPSAVGVALTAAVATAAAPWLTRTWRRWTWVLLVTTTVAGVLTANTPVEPVMALIVGWVAGSAALVVAGGPVRRPTTEAVADGLATVGLPLVRLDKASVDARGSTPYFGVDAEGQRYFVKALGADERSADLLFRAYRRVSPRELGDERSFSSLRRTVEHEALVALTARDLGVRTPRFRAFGRVEPDAFVLAYEAIEGSSLDGVEPERFDDALLAAVWDQVTVLRRYGIAHRDLRLANVFRAADGEVWLIDFGFSELAASDLLLATDLAELVASTSLVVGAERAVAAGVAAVGAPVLATAAPRLRPFALSGATRTGMKADPERLDALRAQVAALDG